jgi:hypothetical protein
MLSKKIEKGFYFVDIVYENSRIKRQKFVVD